VLGFIEKIKPKYEFFKASEEESLIKLTEEGEKRLAKYKLLFEDFV